MQAPGSLPTLYRTLATERNITEFGVSVFWGHTHVTVGKIERGYI